MCKPDLSSVEAANTTLQALLDGQLALPPVYAALRGSASGDGGVWATTLGGAVEALEALWGTQLDDCRIIRREASDGDPMLLERWVMHARHEAPVPWSITAKVRLDAVTGEVVAHFDPASAQVGSTRYPRPAS